MTQCSCGKPEVCDYHEYQSWQVTYGNGWPFGLKDDYRESECDAGTCTKEGCEGWGMGTHHSPAPTLFETGTRVRVGRYGANGIMDSSRPDDSTIYPHHGRVGKVVKRVDERLYAVEFAAGETLCFYHNELHPIVPEPRTGPEPTFKPTDRFWFIPWVGT